MTYEIAEKAIEMALQNRNSDLPKLTLSFFGGEPLLEFDTIIKPLVLKYQNKLSYRITTNGTLLNANIIQFLKDNDFTVILSIDGVEELQLLQRPAKNGENSFQMIMENIKLLQKSIPQLTIRSTLTKKSIPYLYDNIVFFNELKLEHIYISPNIYEAWSDVDKQLFLDQLNYIYLFLQHNNIKVYPLSTASQTINNLCFENSILHCGLGTSNYVVDYKGDIYICHELVTELSNIKYKIGNIFTGIDNVKHKMLLKSYCYGLNNFNCNNNCSIEAKKLCLSTICPAKLFLFNFQRTNTECSFIQLIAESASKNLF